MLQKTIDMLRALWARQAEFPSSLWDDVLSLDSRYIEARGGHVNIFVITRGGRVRWEQGKVSREEDLGDFMRAFPGTLDEREVRRRGQEILLLTVPPQKIRMQDLITCRNAEVRMRILGRCGNQIFLRDRGTRVVDQNATSRLIKINPHRARRPFSLIEVRDATSGELYVLRVPPAMRTCRAAVAWTFGLRTEEYQPVKET